MNFKGYRIRQRRESLHISQEELADMIGTYQKQISRYENDENSPTADVIIALAKALSTSPNWLLGFEDDKGSYFSDIEKELISMWKEVPPEKERAVIRAFSDIVSLTRA